MLRSAIEKGKCMSSLRITYSKWHRVNELKAKTLKKCDTGFWVRLQRRKKEKKQIVFSQEGPTLRVVNISGERREQIEQSQRRDEQSLHSLLRECLNQMNIKDSVCTSFYPQLWCDISGSSVGTDLDQYPTVNGSWPWLLFILPRYWWNLRQRWPGSQPLPPVGHPLLEINNGIIEKTREMLDHRKTWLTITQFTYGEKLSPNVSVQARFGLKTLLFWYILSLAPLHPPPSLNPLFSTCWTLA